MIRLAATFPALQRVTSYATPINLNHKSVEELRSLRDNRLTQVYFGVESGSDEILKRIRKGASRKTMISALDNAREAGLKVSATVILGLGGRTLWREHIDGTAALINAAPPTYLSTLQLYLDEGVAEDFMTRFNRYGEPFQWQDDDGVLAEQERLLAALDPATPVIFRSNHASNCLALAGTLPRDRDRLMAIVAAARAGATPIRPRFMRGL